MKDISFRERYGPWALIAGASEGLGKSFALQLAEKGLNLVLAARREQLLSDTANEIVSRFPVLVRKTVCDLARPDSLDVLAATTADIEIGLAVYNAAVSHIGEFIDFDLDTHISTILTNCHGPVRIAHYFGKKMIQRKKGGIILMSSLSAFQGTPLISTYGATKAFNLILAEGLHVEYSYYGVDVLTCCPGPTLTPGYIRTRPEGKGPTAIEMQADPVVKETLKALGKRALIIPGKLNRFIFFIMNHLLSRKQSLAAMGKSTYAIYGDDK